MLTLLHECRPGPSSAARQASAGRSISGAWTRSIGPRPSSAPASRDARSLETPDAPRAACRRADEWSGREAVASWMPSIAQRDTHPNPGLPLCTTEPAHTAELDRLRVGHGETTPCPEEEDCDEPNTRALQSGPSMFVATGVGTMDDHTGRRRDEPYAARERCQPLRSVVARGRYTRDAIPSRDGGRFDGTDRARSARGRGG